MMMKLLNQSESKV